jgi:hypothetical protein
MTRLCIALLFLAGCGSGGHGSNPTATPPPAAAFADVAGTYAATTTFATGQPYDVTPVGTDYTVTIAADGTVTVSNGVSASVFHLHRMSDGTFTTDGRSIAGGLTEFGSAPASLTACTLRALKLWAGFTDQGTLYGSENLILVRQVSG